jgi:hypothetical protein
MRRFEYCALMLNLLQGSAEIVFYKMDGQHKRIQRLEKQQLSNQERDDMVGVLLAEMGEHGWRMCGVNRGVVFYFERQLR